MVLGLLVEVVKKSDQSKAGVLKKIDKGKIDVLKKKFSEHIKTVLPVVKSNLKVSLVVTNKQPDHSNETIIPFWKEAYYSLVMLEKMLSIFPEFYFQKDLEMKIAFDSFQMISSKIGQEGCQHYAMHILLLLCKVCKGFAGKVISDDMKQLAEEVRGSIKGILGIKKFVQVCDQIRMMNLKAKRDKRKNEEKAMAVLNPERSAKRKLKLATKNPANKKRKIMKMKIGTWNH